MISKSIASANKPACGPGWRAYLILFAASLAIYVLVSAIQTTPGYMDAEYYTLGGFRIATTMDWREPYLWNYLNQRSGSLPVPAFTYWMPLTSLLAAILPALLKTSTFWMARIPFIFLSGLIPPVTAWVGWTLYRSIPGAILGGLLAVFSGFYLSYLGTTDTFPAYMLLGAIFLQLTFAYQMRPTRKSLWVCSLGFGLVAGAMHLARADGVLWLGISGLVVLYWLAIALKGSAPGGKTQILFSFFAALVFVLAGYSLIMGPWFARNIGLFGAIFPPDSGRIFWLTNYDEMFSNPTTSLTVQHWLESGLASILKVRFDAFMLNLQTLLVIQGGIFLWPLSLLGAWRVRKDTRVWIAGIALAIGFVLMTVIFPLAGSRGGYFHSGAAIQVLLWASAPAGLSQTIEWGQKLRGWKYGQAWTVFSAGLVILCMLVTGLFTYKRIVGSDLRNPVWNESQQQYVQLGKKLSEQGAAPDEVVMVNNPPGFYYATGHPAVVIPTNGEAGALEAARQYHVTILLVDKNNEQSLGELYRNPGDQSFFRYRGSVGDTKIYFLEFR